MWQKVKEQKYYVYVSLVKEKKNRGLLVGLVRRQNLYRLINDSSEIYKMDIFLAVSLLTGYRYKSFLNFYDY